MSLGVNTLTIDSRDPSRLARFWAEALSWHVLVEHDSEALVAPARSREEAPQAIAVLFVKNDAPKTGKNRFHFDLVPDDRDAEVRRLEAMGATRADIGQGDVSWVVMRDPEGNEFCVLRSYEGDQR